MENGFDITPSGMTGYLAPEGFESQLAIELETPAAVHGRLMLAEGAARTDVFWTQNTWFDPVFIRADSIGQLAAGLRSLQRNWALLPPAGHHRRASLIAEKLPHVSAKPLVFPSTAPKAPLGSWTLLEPDLILASPHCASPFPNGDARFVEDHVNPPARAYLKLWETFTLAGVMPKPGETCLDLGACPGSWTWVLQKLGARVTAVDKAPLDPRIQALPGVTFLAQSAFALKPADIGPVDWLFSDVICYPARLLRVIREWMESGLCHNFVCTLKFQGQTDFDTLRAFAAIPGSRLIHLSCNRHELTWINLGYTP